MSDLAGLMQLVGIGPDTLDQLTAQLSEPPAWAVELAGRLDRIEQKLDQLSAVLPVVEAIAPHTDKLDQLAKLRLPGFLLGGG